VSGSGPDEPGRRRDLLHLAGALLLLILGIWANTGTLAPYAATLANPLLWEPCNFALNIDHFHFKATFLMLDGAPRDQWEFSVVLRRLLYPFLAYPFMKLLGFGAGGLVVNVLLAAGSLTAFWLGLQRRLCAEASPAVLWLLATYPGFAYWAGLPYSYACIVPFSLLCMVLLWRVESLTTWREALVCGLALGVLFTGYDLLPFFGSAAVLILLARRLWGPCVVLATAQLVPAIAAALLLKTVFGVPLLNSNSEVYATVLKSYFSIGRLSPAELQQWRAFLAGVPKAALEIFLYSNFLFLPLLFLLCLLAAARLPRNVRLLRPAEASLLAAGLALFLFANLAPPYPGWPLRGVWIARIYQPAGVALLAYVAALSARARLLSPGLRRALRGAIVVAAAANAWVVFAPALGSAALSQFVYFRFYRHAPEKSYSETLARIGARPVGFCASAPAAPLSVRH
jgi:hypothetical protein